jgi:putative redox protein
MTKSIFATVDPAGCRVEGRNARGHAVVMDGSPPEGRDEAMGAREALLAALAACTACDVASILRKKRQSATAYEIAVSGETAADPPRVFTRITVEHRVRGAVEPEALRRSIELSATKYCPVNAMLSASVTVEHRYRLETADGEDHEALVAVTGPHGVRLGP